MELNSSQLFFVHCLSPVHIGTGEGVGLIDMPIMRERVTKWPIIPGSTTKGVHRDYFVQQRDKESWIRTAFGAGKGEADAEGNAGSIVMSDARILAFPVASYYGTFAYVTCPMVIKRLERDMGAANVSYFSNLIEKVEGWEKKLSTNEDKALIGHRCEVTDENNEKIYLDEFELSVVIDGTFGELTNSLAKLVFKDDHFSQELLASRLVLVSDESFQYFVTQCSEITPRIRLKAEEKVVDDGALWYEEYLPTETLLYGLIWCEKMDQVKESWKRLSKGRVLQVGGNATVGRGRVRYLYTGGDYS